MTRSPDFPMSDADHERLDPDNFCRPCRGAVMTAHHLPHPFTAAVSRLAYRVTVEGDPDDVFDTLDEAADSYAESMRNGTPTQVFRGNADVTEAARDVIRARLEARGYDRHEMPEWIEEPDPNIEDDWRAQEGWNRAKYGEDA